MSKAQKSLDIKIMDREFRVACADDEEADLLAAVDYLDRKMREIHDSGKVIGAERVAILAALNIANEFLTARVPAGFDVADIKRRMTRMQSLISEAMLDQEALF
jgi:cell division protein ZapA